MLKKAPIIVSWKKQLEVKSLGLKEQEAKAQWHAGKGKWSDNVTDSQGGSSTLPCAGPEQEGPQETMLGS